MGPSQQVIVELEVLLSQYLEISNQTGSLEAIKAKIKAHIHDLLGSGMPRLMGLMYLVDVKEELFTFTIQNTSEAELPDALAKLVIDRLLQKVYTRLYYRK